MKPLKFVAAFAALMLSSIGIATAQQVVKVAYPPFGPPLYSVDAKTNLATGAYVEVLNAVAKDAGLSLQYHPLLVSDLALGLTSKMVDVAAGGMTITPENQAQFDFSDPIANATEAFLVKKTDATAYKSWDDFKGMVIGVQSGTVYVDPLQKSGLFPNIKIYGSSPELYQAVSTGEIKAGVSNAIILANLLGQGQWPDLKVAPGITTRIAAVNAFAFRKGQDDVVKKINVSLAKLKADGTVKTIFAKYGIEFAMAK